MHYIISLGGSLIVPDKVDVDFLKQFRKIILRASKNGNRFLIVTGGGQTVRSYQQAARKAVKASADDLDWIGVVGDALNAELMRAVFGKLAYPHMLHIRKIPRSLRHPVVVASGGDRPGGSSDTTAVAFGRKFGAKIIVNLTDVDYVYDRDPRKFKNAKPIEKMTWRELRTKFKSRKPGQHLPFDPTAAKLAEKAGISVLIMNGRKLANFERFLANEYFRGTIIHPSRGNCQFC
jgi:uridylate kinase